jgi:hypothetical protein
MGARMWQPCDDIFRSLLLVIGIRLINAPNVENLPAFLEHGEDDLDVAAIFMGGRRPYARPKDSNALSSTSLSEPTEDQGFSDIENKDFSKEGVDVVCVGGVGLSNREGGVEDGGALMF